MAWKPVETQKTTGAIETGPEARPEIILVGVVHGDPAGFEKASELLERCQPAVVSVEISVYSWLYRRRHQGRWLQQYKAAVAALPPGQRQHPALQRLGAQIAMPFEVRAAQAYGRRYHRPWQAVDIQALAREHLPRYGRELLSARNLRQLVTTAHGDWLAAIQREYAQAVRLVNSPTPVRRPWLPAQDPQTTMREKVLAGRVARLARRWLRMVHLGGWEHLVLTGTYLTMADYLAPQQPQRLVLAGSPADLASSRQAWPAR